MYADAAVHKFLILFFYRHSFPKSLQKHLQRRKTEHNTQQHTVNVVYKTDFTLCVKRELNFINFLYRET